MAPVAASRRLAFVPVRDRVERQGCPMDAQAGDAFGTALNYMLNPDRFEESPIRAIGHRDPTSRGDGMKAIVSAVNRAAQGWR